MSDLLPDLIYGQAERFPEATALIAGETILTYGELAGQVRAFAGAVLKLGLGSAERVGMFLEKRVEAVVATFGASAAGGVFVAINPLYRGRHVSHILRDCNVRVLVTSAARLRGLGPSLKACTDLRAVILVDDSTDGSAQAQVELPEGTTTMAWEAALEEGGSGALRPHRRIDGDMTAIFYTSGSTGMPKGVVQSHRNMVIGARSICSYLENNADDRLLAALPISFDAGFSHLTTAFKVGARVVLLNYLMPRDVINAVVKHGITGLTGVPPLFIQLTRATWPEGAGGRAAGHAGRSGGIGITASKPSGCRLPSCGGGRTSPTGFWSRRAARAVNAATVKAVIHDDRKAIRQAVAALRHSLDGQFPDPGAPPSSASSAPWSRNRAAIGWFRTDT